MHQYYRSVERVNEHKSEAKIHLTETEQSLTALQRQIQKVRDEMNTAFNLHANGGLSKQGFMQFYNPAEERLNQLLVELPKLEAELARLKVDEVSSEVLVHESKTLYELWPTFDIDRKRSVIESVFERIESHESKYVVKFSDSPTSEELCKNHQQMAPATG